MTTDDIDNDMKEDRLFRLHALELAHIQALGREQERLIQGTKIAEKDKPLYDLIDRQLQNSILFAQELIKISRKERIRLVD